MDEVTAIGKIRLLRSLGPIPRPGYADVCASIDIIEKISRRELIKASTHRRVCTETTATEAFS